MKLFILGLIILLILVCQIYKIIKEKNPNKYRKKKDREGLSEYEENIKHRDEFIEHTSDYYEKLIDKKDYELGKKIDSNIGGAFIYLDSRNTLNYENRGQYLKVKNMEGFHGKGSAINDYGKEIDKCRAITKCGMLNEPGYENCGYCGKLGDKKGYQDSATGGYNQDGKFDYMPNALGGKQVGPDVCPSDALEAHPPKTSDTKKPLGNRWATTAYDCEKIKMQDKCSEVKDCGDLNNAEFGDICGWCPSDKAYPKDSDDNLLYTEDNIVNLDAQYSNNPGKTQVKGDSCAALNETSADANGKLTPYFSTLQKADECSVCDNSGGQVVVESKPKWSEDCIQDLWTSTVKGDHEEDLSSKILVKCSTAYDAPPGLDAGGIYYKNYGDKDVPGRPVTSWGYEKWYKVRNDMQNEVTYPIFNFKKDYNTRIDNTDSKKLFEFGDESNELDKDTGKLIMDGGIRRSYIMNSEVYDNASKFKDSYHKYPNLRIDQKWKQCFNKENNENELKCVPVKELQDLENIVFPTESDGLTYKDLDDWKTRCNELKNINKCEVNAFFPNGSGKPSSTKYDSLPEVMCKELN